MTIGSVLASWRRSQRRDCLPPSFLSKESEAEPISRSEWDKEQNRSRFPLQLVCCRASEELTFYLSLAISALEAAVFAIQTFRPAQFPPPPAVGCEHAHLCAFTFQENVFPIFVVKYGIYQFEQNGNNQANATCSIWLWRHAVENKRALIYEDAEVHVTVSQHIFNVVGPKFIHFPPLQHLKSEACQKCSISLFRKTKQKKSFHFLGNPDARRAEGRVLFLY